MQSYLVFQPVFKSFKTSTNNDKVIAWKSNSLSEKLLNILLHQIKSLSNNTKVQVKFDGNCLSDNSLYPIILEHK